jgi:ornithine cyclodeaminase
MEPFVVDIVRATYVAHFLGATVNPPSYFLRFPADPTSRIIGLPASLNEGTPIAGMKWIASFPRNRDAGIPRASAVIILNSGGTGFPFACLEGSLISAERTAASATLAADWLTRGATRPRSLACIGLGPICMAVFRYLRSTGWTFDTVALYDTAPEATKTFRGQCEALETGGQFLSFDSPEPAIRSAGLVVFATTAPKPHITSMGWFDHNPVVLHISLRDLSPEIVVGTSNIVDDASHCLRAGTSLHLAQMAMGNSDFITGSLAELMLGKVVIPGGRPRVFSPFGLGVLDLAVSYWVYNKVLAAGHLEYVPSFFSHEANETAVSSH